MADDHGLELRADGKWYERLPRKCSKGHRLWVGWIPCRCNKLGHRTLDCFECKKTAYRPEKGERCRDVYPAAPGS